MVASGERPKREDDVEISAPLGWKVRFPAKSLSATVVILSATGFLAYMIRDHDMRQAEALAKVIAERTIQMTEISKQQTAIIENLETLTYVATLNETEAKRLKLDMPNSLRMKLLNQERGR